MAKMEELFLKEKRTPQENEQLRTYIRSLESLTRGSGAPKPEVYSKAEVDRMLADVRKQIQPTVAPQWYYPYSPGWPGTSGYNLTSSAWAGNPRSTIGKTLLPLGATFGVPAGCKAVLVYVVVRDLVSSGGNYYIILSPTSLGGSGSGIAFSTELIPNDQLVYNMGIIPCNPNGDIYYQVNASGAGTLDVWIEIAGYYR